MFSGDRPILLSFGGIKIVVKVSGVYVGKHFTTVESLINPPSDHRETEREPLVLSEQTIWHNYHSGGS